jgi:hypothetical protein
MMSVLLIAYLCCIQKDRKTISTTSTTSTFTYFAKRSKIDNAAIDRIVEYSIELPGLASLLALLCLKSAHQLGINKVDKTTVERVALVEGFATSLKVTQQQEKKLALTNSIFGYFRVEIYFLG